MAITMPIWKGSENIQINRKLFFSVRQRAPTTLVVDVTIEGVDDLVADIGTCAMGVLLYSQVTGYYIYSAGNANDKLHFLPISPSVVDPSHVGEFSPVPYTSAGLNFYWPDIPRQRWNRLAEIMGFHKGVASLKNGCLSAPNVFNLQPPAYVLLDIELNHFSSNFMHRAGQDVLQQLMGKVVLFSNFRYERTAGITRLATGLSYVSDLRIRLLTPWHTVWPLHGLEWSCTLVFGSAFKSVNTEI
jgi:hypothetical protein